MRVSHVVFAQTGDGAVPVVELLRNARHFFSASIDVLEAEGARVRLAVELPGGQRARFSVIVEPVTAALLERAARAEVTGRAAGMAALAGRCKCVWRIEPEGDAADPVLFTLAAALASVALGPVLPPDDSSLFGVRGALKRAERR
jgi:hypothetical protein